MKRYHAVVINSEKTNLKFQIEANLFNNSGKKKSDSGFLRMQISSGPKIDQPVDSRNGNGAGQQFVCLLLH